MLRTELTKKLKKGGSMWIERKLRLNKVMWVRKLKTQPTSLDKRSKMPNNGLERKLRMLKIMLVKKCKT